MCARVCISRKELAEFVHRVVGTEQDFNQKDLHLIFSFSNGDDEDANDEHNAREEKKKPRGNVKDDRFILHRLTDRIYAKEE